VFACFGLYLPRNSGDQAKAGRFVSLDGLEDQAKEQAILEQGRPLWTILFMPGHVMLYLGPDPASGRAVVCHNLWGLRTRRLFHASPGRWVLGRTVITTLEPGKELTTLVRPGGLLIHRVSGMVFLD